MLPLTIRLILVNWNLSDSEAQNQNKNYSWYHVTENKSFLTPGSLAAIVVTLLATWGIIKETNSTKDTQQLIRIEKLEASNETLDKERYDLRQKIFKLERVVEKEFNRVGYLESFLDQLPNPSWVKSYDGDKFRMEFINIAYEKLYKVPKLAYLNKTDEEVWGVTKGEQYHQNDLKVLKSKRPLIALESVSVDGKDINRHIIKFIVRFAAPDEFGVGGIQFDLGDQSCDSKVTSKSK